MDQEQRLNPLDKFGVIPEVFNGKVVLTCKKHIYSYNPRKQPTPGCKGCHFVQHLGLLIAVPAERREEILSNLEFSVAHLVEAANRGELDIDNLERQGVKIRIEQEDGQIKEY